MRDDSDRLLVIFENAREDTLKRISGVISSYQAGGPNSDSINSVARACEDFLFAHKKVVELEKERK